MSLAQTFGMNHESHARAHLVIPAFMWEAGTGGLESQSQTGTTHCFSADASKAKQSK